MAVLKLEPRFSEAMQGASVRNCYIESGFSGKGQTRMRGRRDIAKAAGFQEWDNTLAVHESSKTGNIYILAQTNYDVELMALRNGELETVMPMGPVYDKKVKCNFAEMRFLNNKYVENFTTGLYGILFVLDGKLYVLDDQNPAEEPQHISEFGTGDGEIKLGSVAVVANRIIVSELDGATWHWSRPGGLGWYLDGETGYNGEGEIFYQTGFNDSEYSGDSIVRVARIAGIRLGVFGERTLEIWDISDNPQNPFTTSFQGQVWKTWTTAMRYAEANTARTPSISTCSIWTLSRSHTTCRKRRSPHSTIKKAPPPASPSTACCPPGNA